MSPNACSNEQSQWIAEELGHFVSYARTILGPRYSREDAEEAVARTLLYIAANPEKVPAERIYFGNWTRRAIRHRCFHMIRDGRFTDPIDSPSFRMGAYDDDLAERLDADIALRQVFAALASLPQADRRLLLSVAMEGMSISDAATLHDKNNDQIAGRLVKIRETLRVRSGHVRPERKTTANPKGVSYYPRNKKWGATVYWQRKRYFVGLYDQPEDAARAYEEKRTELMTTRSLVPA